MKPHFDYLQPAKIETLRLILRPMAEADAPLVVAWRNHQDNLASFLSPQLLTLESHLEWFRGPRLDRVDYMIETREDGRAVGTLHFKNIDSIKGTAESGRLIGDRVNRGRGFGLESAIAWLRYGFDSLGLKKVWGVTRVSNQANIAINLALGGRIEAEGPAKDLPESFLRMVLTLEEARGNGLF